MTSQTAYFVTHLPCILYGKDHTIQMARGMHLVMQDRETKQTNEEDKKMVDFSSKIIRSTFNVGMLIGKIDEIDEIREMLLKRRSDLAVELLDKHEIDYDEMKGVATELHEMKGVSDESDC
jgi:hypothetical protein